jgi:hypothetical protein
MASRCLLACLLLLPVATTAGAAVPYGEPFTLAVEQAESVGTDGLLVGFAGLLEDSRCPADVLCFWPGDAAASLMIQPAGQDPEFIVLHTFADFARQIDIGLWRIILHGVMPYPASIMVPIDPAAYEVTVEVQLLGPVEITRTTWSAAKARYR